jgi:iron(III) transport system substrate-binding protein
MDARGVILSRQTDKYQKSRETPLEKLERVTIYASLGLRPGISELLWAFRKKHTMEEFPVYLDDHPFQAYDRIKAETKNGMRTADIVIMPHYMLLKMKNDGMLAQHDSREAAGFAGKFHDRDGNWFAAAVTFMGMSYNSRVVAKKDIPGSLEDLSRRAWAGRLGVQSLTSSRVGNLGAQYLAYLRRVVGERRWSRFVESLSKANRPKAYDCIDHLIQGLLEGGNDLALTVYSLAYYREKTAGSPVAYLEIEDAPLMLTYTSAGILKNSQESESAHRFLEFLLSEPAQKIIGGIKGMSPIRPGVNASYPFDARYSSRSEFHPDETDLAELPSALETFRKLKLP